jgi:hypothetical protein
MSIETILNKNVGDHQEVEIIQNNDSLTLKVRTEIGNFVVDVYDFCKIPRVNIHLDEKFTGELLTTTSELTEELDVHNVSVGFDDLCSVFEYRKPSCELCGKTVVEPNDRVSCMVYDSDMGKKVEKIQCVDCFNSKLEGVQ